MLKVINIQDLRPGMMITQVIEQNGPVKIRKVGLVRSQDMLTGLAEMGVLKVEIDTEQSLELEPEATPTSMTQKLLQGEFDHAQSVDSSLSESFNRSLFLPSVSELPSMWQIHARQGGLLALVILCGLSLGFAAAVLPPWFTQRVAGTASIEHSAVSQPPAQIDDTELATSQHDAPEKIENGRTDSASTGAPVTQQPSPNSSVEQPSTERADTQLETPSDAEDLANTGTSTVNSALTNTPSNDTNSDTGRILNPSQTEEPVSGVSAELLARFNQALEAIENEPEDEVPETQVTVRSDLPRVDQLPARLLTRLPAMSFSAHMYASAPQNRWVRVNGQQLFESEWINDQVQLINIEPQRVVLSFEGELFTMAALTDW